MKPLIPVVDLIISIILICAVSVFVIPHTYAHTYIYGMCVALIARVVGYIPWCKGELSPSFYSKRIRMRNTWTEVIVQIIILIFWLCLGMFYSFALFFVGFHGMWLWYLGVDEVVARIFPSEK